MRLSLILLLSLATEWRKLQIDKEDTRIRPILDQLMNEAGLDVREIKYTLPEPS